MPAHGRAACKTGFRARAGAYLPGEGESRRRGAVEGGPPGGCAGAGRLREARRGPGSGRGPGARRGDGLAPRLVAPGTARQLRSSGQRSAHAGGHRRLLGDLCRSTGAAWRRGCRRCGPDPGRRDRARPCSPCVRPRTYREGRFRADAVEARVHSPRSEVLPTGVHDRPASPRLRGGLEHPPRPGQLPAQRPGERGVREAYRSRVCAPPGSPRAPGRALVGQRMERSRRPDRNALGAAARETKASREAQANEG